MIKEATSVNPPITENIPEELAERAQWVCWRYEVRDAKKPTKVPYAPSTERRASSTDSMTWATFDEALEAYSASDGRYSGIGFVFSSGDPFVGIDLDDCRDPESGEITPWAAKILARVEGGYIEASPSGAGVHVIVEGTVRGGGRAKKKVRLEDEVVGEVEMYGHERFFTVTGAIL